MNIFQVKDNTLILTGKDDTIQGFNYAIKLFDLRYIEKEKPVPFYSENLMREPVTMRCHPTSNFHIFDHDLINLALKFFCLITGNLLAASFVETSEFDSMVLVYDIKYNQGLEIRSKISEGCRPFLTKGSFLGKTNKYEFPRDAINVAFHPNDANCLFIPYFDPHSAKRYSNIWAWNLSQGSFMASYQDFRTSNFDIVTFYGKPYMAVTNGFCPGSVSLMAADNFQLT